MVGTAEHPFYVPARRAFVAMGLLERGMVLLGDGGRAAEVVGVARRAASSEVFNVEVERAHTYFVCEGVDGGCELVHNACHRRFDGPKPKYGVNPAHDPRSPNYNPRKTPLPADAERVYQQAVPDESVSPRNWYGINSDGVIYRFSSTGDGTVHFSGMSGLGDGIRNITDYALRRLGGR